CRLRHRRVSGVADEDVPEPEGILAEEARRLGGEDEALPHERVQVQADAVRELRRRELDDGAPPELLADDRRALDDRLLLGIEPIEPRSEQRVDRRRDRQLANLTRDPPAVLEHERAVVHQPADALFQQQRVAVRGLLDVRAHLRVELRRTEQVAEQGLDVLALERLEDEALPWPTGPE